MGVEAEGAMTLESAARLLGVHYQTAYRWVRGGVLPAVKVDSEYRLNPADVEELAESRRTHQPVSYTGRRRDWARLRDQLHDALAAGDETGARRIFERVRLGHVPILEQCEELLAPVMRRMGEQLSTGDLSAARLRLAAGIAERCLALALSWVCPRSQGLVLVASPEAEQHRLPSVMAKTVLREAGWAVWHLWGLSDAEIVAGARRAKPALAVISVAHDGAQQGVERLQARLQSEASVPVLVGRCGDSLTGLVEDAVTIGTRLLR